MEYSILRRRMPKDAVYIYDPAKVSKAFNDRDTGNFKKGSL
jgi:hypothetical protein